MAHRTCAGSTRQEIRSVLEKYEANGVENILALRGDPREDDDADTAPCKNFCYAADLVAFIKEHFPQMCIGAAGFVEGRPGAPNRLREIEYLADSISTRPARAVPALRPGR